MNAMSRPVGHTDLTVVCVLKKDGPYDFGYVKILSQGMRRTLDCPHRFVCLTDVALLHRDWFRAHRIICRPLYHDWPGAWSKVELFRPGLGRGRLLHLDLSVMATGSLSALIGYKGPIAILGEGRRARKFSSDVMTWEAGTLGSVYERFAGNPADVMEKFDNVADWIASACRAVDIDPLRIQDVAPNLCADIQPIPGGSALRVNPPGAGLIRFSGHRMPHELAEESEFVREHWA